MKTDNKMSQQGRRFAVFVFFPSLAMLLLSCSALKLDKDKNCLNQASGCFKPDNTRPQFVSSNPGEGTAVSLLPYVDLIFSEELKISGIQDFSLSGPGAQFLSLSSVQKIASFTYRVFLNGTVENGIIRIEFNGAKDYNNNTISNITAVQIMGNVDIVVPISANHGGVSPTGYPDIAINWQHNYIPPDASNTVYEVRLATGAIDCAAATPVTPLVSPAPVPPVGVVLPNTASSFTLDTTIITTLGAQAILVCVTNTSNNRRGTGIHHIVRHNGPPATTLAPLAGPYASPKTLTFTCNDYSDKVAYTVETTVGTGLTPADPPDPQFNASTGAITQGTLYDPDNKPQTPYSGNPTHSIFKWRCIDKAGNIESVKPAVLEQFIVDSNLPEVTFVSLTRHLTGFPITGISTGGYTSADLTWQTNQVNKSYEIRRGSTACGAGGGGVQITSGTTPLTANQPITNEILPSDLASGDNNLRICVVNGALTGQESVNILLDNSAPASPVTVSVPGGAYGTVQNITFTCDNNADKIAYTSITAPGVVSFTAAEPADPTFNTTSGAILSGTQHSTPIATPNGSTTKFKWRCIDKAGNLSPGIDSATYVIDTILPNITVVSNQHTALSSAAGGYTTSQLVWNSSRAGLTYRIRRDATTCSNGTQLGSDQLTPDPVNGVIQNVVTTLNIADFPTNLQTYSILICVYNFVNQPGYSTTGISITRDNNIPTLTGPATIMSATGGVLSLDWPDGNGTGSSIAGYRIFRGTAAGSYLGYPNSPEYQAVTSAATITLPDAVTPYFLRIVAVDAAGNLGIISPGDDLPSKPTITIVVTGLSGNVTVSDGVATQSYNTDTSGVTWATSIGAGGYYSFSVTAQPAAQVCSIRERQFGNLNANLTIHVDCVDGYMTAGRYQAAPAAKMLSLPYRTRSEVWVSSFAVGELPNSVAVAGNNVYFGTDMDCDAGALVRYCIYRRATATAGSPSLVVNNLPGIVRGIASDGSNLYFTTISGDDRLYKVPLAGGTPIEIAAGFDNPYAMALDGHDAYICNRSAGAIVKVDLRTGIKTNVVTGIADPIGISIVGNYVYFTRWNLHAIFRTLKDGTGSIETPYGSAASFGHIDDIGTAARFKTPHDLASDGVDNLFVAEYNNHTIRRIRLANGRVTTLVGDSTIASMIYSNGTGPAAHLPRPVGLTSDGRNLYASLHGERRIIKLFEDKLTAHWPLAGNTNDYGGDGNFVKNGTITGNVSAAGGRYGETGGAYSFDGASDYIASPAGSAADTYFNTSNFTISFWIKPATVQLENGGAPRDYDVVTNLGSQYDYAIRYHNEIASAATIPPNTPGQLIFVRFDGTVSAYCMSGVRIDDGNFHHVAAQKLGGTIQLFIDGRKACSTADTVGTINLASVVPLQIGARPGFANNDFTGSIAEMRTYRRALSEGEINELAQDAGGTTQVGSGYNTGATGLLSHYEFNANGATPTTTDSGPLGYTLTPQGSPGTVFGKDGDPTGAFHLNGSNQYLTNATTAGLPMGNHPRTLCGWIRPASYPGTSSSYYMMGYSGSTLSQLGMGNYSGSQGIVYHSNNDLVHIPYTLPLNTWSHLCAAYTGTQVTIYLNGKALGTEPAVSSTAFGASGTFVGIQPNLAYALHGAVDDVRIYDNTLGELQIRQLATQVPMGLVAHFDLSDDIAGAKAVDSSGRGESASIAGATQSSDRFGNTNQAYNFNSSAHNITGSDAGLPTGSSPRTLCAWIRPTAYPAISYGHIIKYGTAATGRMAGLTLYNNSGIQQITHSAYAADHNVTYAVPLNTWTHICASYTPGTPNISQIFINGASYSGASMTTFDTTLAGNSGLSIGNAMYDTAQRLTGDIDDVRVYSRALTTNDVRTLAGYHPVQVTNGFSDMKMHLEPEAAAYANGGCNGGINCISAWSDSSTSMNNVAQGTAGSQPVFEASGINGKPSVKFVGGSATYLTGACSSALNSAATTMLTVYREINTTGHNGIFQNGAQLAGKMLYFKDNIQPNRPVLFDLAGNTENLAANSTYHSSGDIVLMSLHFNGTTGSLYKNGNLFASTATASAAYNCGGGALHIGRYYFGGTYPSDGGYFDGSLGNFLFYSSVLSAADRLRAECYLSAKYRIPLQGSPPPTCP